MKTFKKCILTAMLPLAFASSLTFAEDMSKDMSKHEKGMHHAHHGMKQDGMYSNLNLTAEQKEQIKKIRAQYKDGMKEQMEAHHGMHGMNSEMQALISAPKFDEAAATKLLESENKAVIKMRLERLKMNHDIFQVLTKEQQDTWMKNKQDMKDKKGMKKDMKKDMKDKDMK